MGKQYDGIDERLRDWLGRQHMFFVATAPSGGAGHVNVSPKGLDSFRVLDAHAVAYLDLTGSGAETIAHIRDDGRITLMFCAFDGPARIVRLYGRGTVVLPDDDAFPDLVARFPGHPGIRSVIRVDVTRVADSCGHGVPQYAYEGQRTRLTEWATARDEQDMDAYWAEKNAFSIDGLPALDPVAEQSQLPNA